LVAAGGDSVLSVTSSYTFPEVSLSNKTLDFKHYRTRWSASGTGTFAAAVNYGVGTNPSSVFSADFNGDGKMDLASANNGSSNVSIRLGSGNGTFTTAVNFSTPNPGSIFSADFNNDGKMDLVTTYTSSDFVSVLLNTTCNASVSLISQSNALCNGSTTGSATVTAGGGAPYTYTWSPSGGNSAIASGLSAGNYTCVVTNSCGATASTTVNITQPTTLSVTALASSSAICVGSLATVTVSATGGAASYIGTGTFTTNVASTTYTVTDGNGCVATKNVSLTINASPTISVNSGTITSGSSFTLVPSGGISYTYSPFGPVVTPTAGTTNYTVTGTNASGCIASATSTVFVNGAALNFDGVNDRVDIGSSLNTILSSSNKITVEAWVKPSTNSGLGCIVSNYNTSNADMQLDRKSVV
jgi:hypothetical protein